MDPVSQCRSDSFRNNCFDYIRLYAALSIVLSHCCRWLQIPPSPLSVLCSQVPGLMLLFTMSGYLIAGSFERSPSPAVFLRRRFVRLFPGLWVAFAVSALVVAVVTSVYGLPVSGWDWAKWVAAQLTVFQFYTPPDLKAYGIGNPNGVLWTIPIEMGMYVLIMLSFRRLQRVGMVGWMLLLAALAGVNVLCGFVGPKLPLLLWKLLFVSIFPYMYMFYIGVFVYVFRTRLIPLLSRCFWPLLLLFAVWQAVNALYLRLGFGLYGNVVSGIAVCFLVFAVAYRFGKRTIRHDYSYSIYLYHEIFINILVVSGCCMRSWLGALLVYAATAVCSYCSCHWVEEPAVRWLKR